MKTFKLNDSLGDVVALFPSAGDLFMDNHIDFCCGGDRTLEIALIELSYPLEKREAFLLNLNKQYLRFQSSNELFTDWANKERSKLIDHILVMHHHFLREALPTLSRLLFKLLEVHSLHHPELFEIHHQFSLLKMELEAHLIKEEHLLFPALIAYETNPSEEALQATQHLLTDLEAEHEAAGDLIKSLRALTDHYTPPQDGCTTYQLTYEKLKLLEKNTFLHIHLENNILFKNL